MGEGRGNPMNALEVEGVGFHTADLLRLAVFTGVALAISSLTSSRRAALLNQQPMGFYAPATLVQDARRHGIRFLPVCVVHSGEHSAVVADYTLRLGLASVRFRQLGQRHARGWRRPGGAGRYEHRPQAGVQSADQPVLPVQRSRRGVACEQFHRINPYINDQKVNRA